MADVTDRCSDPFYRLAFYEAGHALVARALGQKILNVHMLPRPPITVTEKLIVGNSWQAFCSVLELRVMELFGGQIAEQTMCGATTCCSGDISRIDELCRILNGFYEEEDYEDIFFRLEDQTQAIFADPRYREAIVPIADLLFERENAGDIQIAGEDVERVIDRFVPRSAPKPKGVLGLFKRITNS